MKQKKSQKITAKTRNERLGERLGENQIRIINYMNNDKYISIAKMAKKLKISTTAVEKNIKKLSNLELIKRIGPARGGHWKVIEGNDQTR